MKTRKSISGTPGRRAGGEDTRAQIVAAAQELFAAKGLDQTTMREIAAAAGVNPALIVHYFGSKQQLFVASIHPLVFAEGAPQLLAAISHGEADTIGERLARAFVGLISDDERRKLLLGVIRSATSDEKAAELLRQSVQMTLLNEVEKHIPRPDSRLKTTLVGSQLIGILVMRYVSKVEPLASATPEEIVRYLGPRLQGYFE